MGCARFRGRCGQAACRGVEQGAGIAAEGMDGFKSGNILPVQLGIHCSWAASLYTDPITKYFKDVDSLLRSQMRIATSLRAAR